MYTLTRLLTAMLLLSPFAAAGDRSFTGQGTKPSDWNDGKNWSPEGTPQEDDNVIVVGGTAGIWTVYISSAVKVRSLTVYGVPGVSWGGVSGGSITVKDSLTGSGAIVGDATVNIPSGAVLHIRGEGLEFSASTVMLTGQSVWDEGDFVGSHNSVVWNYGEFRAASALPGKMRPAGQGTEEFVNYGTFRRSRFSLFPDTTLITGWTIKNYGAIYVENGVLVKEHANNRNDTLYAGSTLTGTGRLAFTRGGLANHVLLGNIRIDPGCTLELREEGSLAGNGTLTGGGTFLWNGGRLYDSLTIDSSITFRIGGNDPKEIAGGAINVHTDVEYDGQGPLRGGDNAVLNNFRTFSVQTGGSFEGLAGQGQATFNNSGTFIKSAGNDTTRFDGWNLVSNGKIDIRSGVVQIGMAPAPGSDTLRDGTMLTGGGRMLISTTGAGRRVVLRELTVDTATVLELGMSGGMEGNGRINGSGFFEWTGGQLFDTLTILKNCTMVIDSLTDDDQFTGTIVLDGGALLASGDLTTNIVNGGSFDIGPNSTLLRLRGDYTQTQKGHMIVRIDGREEKSYSRLQVQGNAALAGTLEVRQGLHFDVRRGDIFTILTFSERTGAFDSLAGLATSRGDTLFPYVTSSSYQLVTAIGILDPSAGVRWIVGEEDTIRWVTNLSAGTVDIFVSTDSGRTLSRIDTAIDIHAGAYLWRVFPLLSTRCQIFLLDVAHDTLARSAFFKVKGYELTRNTADGQYESFLPERHGWSFANVAVNLWPQPWWQQFDYKNGIDPFTQARYPAGWTTWPNSVKPEDFPDWPLLVRTFGTAQCYWSVEKAAYNVFTIIRWWTRKGQWQGSCFGFATSGLMAFDDSTTFTSHFLPGDKVSTLAQLPVSDERRLVINQLMTSQFGKDHQAYMDQAAQLTPSQTLELIKWMLVDEKRDDRILAIFSTDPAVGVGGHAIVPFKVVPHPLVSAAWLVLIYDSNHPLATDTITVYTDLDSWRYWRTGWNGTNGFYLMEPVSFYVDQPNFAASSPAPGLPPAHTRYARSSRISMYAAPTADLTLKDASGHQTTYIDGRLLNEIPGTRPLIPITGGLSEPYGYSLEAGAYEIMLRGFRDSLTVVTMDLDTVLLSYRRGDAHAAQTDRVTFGDGLRVVNEDAAQKQIQLDAVASSEGLERRVGFENIRQGTGDSLEVGIDPSSRTFLTNFGSSTVYDLHLEKSAGGTFVHRALDLEGNSRQTIASTADTAVTILVDRGLDGSIDDTLVVVNQTVSVGEPSGRSVPRTIRLHQNFPNPFNPLTVIAFDLPEAGHVTLAVYDMLGRELAVLVNERREAGQHTVVFDGSTLASGVYIYQMQAGSFRMARKCVIVK